MRPAFFCYELDFAERWIPRLHYDEPLANKSIVRKHVVDVSHLPRNAKGDLVASISVLEAMYPLEPEIDV